MYVSDYHDVINIGCRHHLIIVLQLLLVHNLKSIIRVFVKYHIIVFLVLIIVNCIISVNRLHHKEDNKYGGRITYLCY